MDNAIKGCLGLIALCVAGFGACIYMVGSGPSEDSPSGPTMMMATTDMFACQDRSFMKEVRDAGAAGDTQAVRIAFMAMKMGVEEGQCFEIPKGSSVPLIDAEIFAGILKTRRTGYLGDWYTLLGMFEPNY